MGSSFEGDALVICRLLGFVVNSFDRPPQLGAVGPEVYAQRILSTVFFRDPMSIWRSNHSLSITGARRDPACVGRLAPSIMAKISAGTCCVYSLRRPQGI